MQKPLYPLIGVDFNQSSYVFRVTHADSLSQVSIPPIISTFLSSSNCTTCEVIHDATAYFEHSTSDVVQLYLHPPVFACCVGVGQKKVFAGVFTKENAFSGLAVAAVEGGIGVNMKGKTDPRGYVLVELAVTDKRQSYTMVSSHAKFRINKALPIVVFTSYLSFVDAGQEWQFVTHHTIVVDNTALIARMLMEGGIPYMKRLLMQLEGAIVNDEATYGYENELPRRLSSFLSYPASPLESDLRNFLHYFVWVKDGKLEGDPKYGENKYRALCLQYAETEGEQQDGAKKEIAALWVQIINEIVDFCL